MLKALQQLPDIYEDDLDESSVDSSEDKQRIITNSTEGDATSVKKQRKDNRPWYLKEPIPSFRNEIWPSLRKLGYEWKNHRYSHPVIGSFPDSDALRKHICEYGIPDLEEKKSRLTSRELVQLCRWAVFANVPVNESNSMSELAKVKFLPDNKVIKILVKLGFSSFDNKFFPPGADHLKGCHKAHQEGVHFFRGLEGILLFIHSHENFNIDGDGVYPPGRRKGPAVSEADLLSLRL